MFSAYLQILKLLTLQVFIATRVMVDTSHEVILINSGVSLSLYTNLPQIYNTILLIHENSTTLFWDL